MEDAKGADPIEEKPGLEVRWSVGERIPWKGIWFQVARVDKQALLLVPDSMTWKHTKRIEEAKNARG